MVQVRQTVAGPKGRQASSKLFVGIILTPRFTLSALASFVDVLRLAADEGDRSQRIRCDWTILSDTMEIVQSSCGMKVCPDRRLCDPRQFDYLAVAGGLIDHVTELSRPLQDYLLDAAAKKVPLIGICTGGFVLHQLGLMRGYKCCVSWFHHTDFLERFDGLEPVSDQLFVVDRDRLTCPGGTSAAYLASWLVQKHVGETHARKSLRMMHFQHIEQPETAQPGLPLTIETDNSALRKAMQYMQQNLDASLTVNDVATHVKMSRRQLERKFKSQLVTTPSQMLRRIRLEHAALLLKTTDLSLSMIAIEAGFSDDSHLIRMFRAFKKMTPASYRKVESAQATTSDLVQVGL